MDAVLLEILAKPRESVGARCRSIGPEVRPPHYQRRLFRRVVQRPGARVGRLASHLVDLGFDQPFHREAALIRIRLGFEISSRIPAIYTARDKNDAQVRVPDAQRPHYEAKVREKDARIGAIGGERYRRLWIIELEPDRLNLIFAQTQWREPSNLDAIVVGGFG